MRLLQRLPVPVLEHAKVSLIRRVVDLTRQLVGSTDGIDHEVASRVDDIVIFDLYGFSDDEVSILRGDYEATSSVEYFDIGL